MNEDLIAYYQQRVNEYERIYHKPERQEDLAKATELLQKIFRNKEVFEIACGTGFWTEQIAKTARSVFATDINETVLTIAKTKSYSPATVTFTKADLFKLTNSKKYQSLFGGFIWSHIKLEELSHFIDVTNNQVQKGGTVVFMDNNYVQGSSTPITEKDEWDNTYQTRKLDDGTMHKVIKNFPTESFIRQVLKNKAQEIRFINLPYFWLVKFESV